MINTDTYKKNTTTNAVSVTNIIDSREKNNLLNVMQKKVEYTGNNNLIDLLYKVVAMWLLDERNDVSFSGTEEEIKALSEVMMASKEFYQYLKNKNETDPTVLNALLKRKNNFALKFNNIFNAQWPF